MVEEREPAMIADGDGQRPARNETEARRVLKRRRDEVGAHRVGARPFRGPEQERVSFDDLLDALERDYVANRRASTPQLRSHLKHLRAHLGERGALAIDADTIHSFIEARRTEGSSEASIQRELEFARRAFRLAALDRVLTYTPMIPQLHIGNTNAREGFVERGDLEAVLQQLGDEDVRDFAAWAYWTGMRKGEIGKLTWQAFDPEARTLTLPAKDAKSRHGRLLALEGPLQSIMERRLRARRIGCQLIFHRGGRAIREFRKTWARACREAGVPGLLFHDLRRSAVRNMVRAGVDPTIAMKVSGHRTAAVFARYNIVSDEDLRDAMHKTAAYVSALPNRRKVVPITGTDR